MFDALLVRVDGLARATILGLLLLTLPLPEGLSARERDSEVIKPGSRGSVPLGFTVQDPQPRPDLEARMLQLVNQERAAKGQRALRADPELRDVARAHSRDMLVRGYFSHVTPEGKDPFDRLRQANVKYLSAGENLAFAPSLPQLHQTLMNSPGHRANILRAAFGRVGIGIMDGGRRGQMVTQEFRN